MRPSLLPAALLANLATAALVPRAAPSAWVTVDANGHAATITPTVTGSSTINAPPASLTSTGVYTLATGGLTTTSTGLAPIASPTGTGPAGSFLACSDYQGAGTPVCQPRRGTVLNPGKTYYVTWDPAYFNPPNTPVRVEAIYGSSGQGFSSVTLTASTGFYIWTVDANILAQQKSNSLNVSLYIAYPETSSSGTKDLPVPRPGVSLTIAPAPAAPSKGVNPVAVAVPVVVALVVLGLAGFCCWSWRRHGTFPLVGGAMRRRSAQGYGVRQSHSQRTGTGNLSGLGAAAAVPASGNGKGGIPLTPTDSWSPTGGRNVFREELRRQDRDTR